MIKVRGTSRRRRMHARTDTVRLRTDWTAIKIAMPARVLPKSPSGGRSSLGGGRSSPKSGRSSPRRHTAGEAEREQATIKIQATARGRHVRQQSKSNTRTGISPSYRLALGTVRSSLTRTVAPDRCALVWP